VISGRPSAVAVAVLRATDAAAWGSGPGAAEAAHSVLRALVGRALHSFPSTGFNSPFQKKLTT
jgi:hypothetical protein